MLTLKGRFRNQPSSDKGIAITTDFMIDLNITNTENVTMV